MKTYTLKVSNFLSWYFDTGADQEQREQVYDLGMEVIKALKEDGSYQISVMNIFDKCDIRSMPVKYLEEKFEHEDDELGMLDHAFHVKLIN